MNLASSKSITLSVNIGDQLTSVSCGHIIVELIKFLLYQRLQIPYNYQRLKYLITEKKLCSDSDTRESFKSHNHFRTASTTLENLDFITKSLIQEINGPKLPEEIFVSFGPSPLASKEIYRFLLPKFCHKLQCSSSLIASDNKIKCNVLRTLVTSEELGNMFFQSLAPTNMYVYVQKKIMKNQDAIVNSDCFIMKEPCTIRPNSKVIVIDLRKQNKENISCCNDFEIFKDITNEENLNVEGSFDVGDVKSSDDMMWFQSCYVVKGFKDCIVNGSSVTNTWLKPSVKPS